MNSITSQGITISVETKYEAGPSKPDRDYFAFSYHIKITNNRPEAVQLLSRHWYITDANADLKEVKGPGVIGEQPVLEPGESHSYSSWCPLATPNGKMKGYYVMQSQSDHNLFHAQVPEFILTAEFLLN